LYVFINLICTTLLFVDIVLFPLFFKITIVEDLNRNTGKRTKNRLLKVT